MVTWLLSEKNVVFILGIHVPAKYQEFYYFSTGIGKLHRGPNLAHCLVLSDLQVKNGFYIFEWVKKAKRKITFRDVKIM